MESIERLEDRVRRLMRREQTLQEEILRLRCALEQEQKTKREASRRIDRLLTLVREAELG